MRVLLINDLVSFGGTEIQHWREFDLLRERGHDVYSLTMDPQVEACLTGHKRNIPIDDGNIGKAVSRLCARRHSRKLEPQINAISPDVIHLNNVRKAPLDIYRIVRRYPCIQTLRDYGYVCPKGVCIHPDGSRCGGFATDDCVNCGLSLTEKVKLANMAKLTNACLDSCELRVAPSAALAHCSTDNGLPTECLNDPFDFSEIDKSEANEVAPSVDKTFLYFGSIDWIKGIDQLLDAFDSFASLHTDTNLLLAGGIAPRYERSFEQALASRSYATYLGKLPNTEMLKQVRTAYCVVVPSLWLENYPNTVLEAMASKTLVIGANRGGIPELITQEDLLFDVLDKASFVAALERAYYMKAKRRSEVVAANYERITENNTLNRYAERLEALFAKAIAYSSDGVTG